MAEVSDGLPDSFLDPALSQLERLEFAINRVGQAVELELANIALDPTTLDDETREKLQAIGNRLLEIATTGSTVAEDVNGMLGIETDVPASQRPPVQHTEHRPPTAPIGRRPRVRREPATAATPHTPTTRTAPTPAKAPVVAPVAVSEPVKPTEAEAQKTESDLYKRLINIEQTPQMQRAEGAVPVEVAVTADDRIRIGDRELIITGHNRFLFNALMLLRDRPLAAGDIQELGFYPEATNGSKSANFSTMIKGLSELVNQAAGIELIKKVGTGTNTRYCVNPNLVLKEERPDPDLVTANGESQLKKIEFAEATL